MSLIKTLIIVTLLLAVARHERWGLSTNPHVLFGLFLLYLILKDVIEWARRSLKLFR